MLTLQLKRKLLNKAKRMSPQDTGNLRFNAIQGLKWLNKERFTIRYDSGVANYIEYLEEKEYAGGSSTKRNKHKDFIKKTAIEIKNDLESYFNEGKTPSGSMFWQMRDTGDLKVIDRRIYRYQRSLAINEMRRDINDQPRSAQTFIFGHTRR